MVRLHRPSLSSLSPPPCPSPPIPMATTDPRTELPCIPLVLSPSPAALLLSATHARTRTHTPYPSSLLLRYVFLCLSLSLSDAWICFLVSFARTHQGFRLSFSQPLTHQHTNISCLSHEFSSYLRRGTLSAPPFPGWSSGRLEFLLRARN